MSNAGSSRLKSGRASVRVNSCDCGDWLSHCLPERNRFISVKKGLRTDRFEGFTGYSPAATAPGFNFVTKQSQIFLDNSAVLDYGRRASEGIQDCRLSMTSLRTLPWAAAGRRGDRRRQSFNDSATRYSYEILCRFDRKSIRLSEFAGRACYRFHLR